MAIGAVLVDRARVLRKVGASARVEGTTTLTTVPGAWFRARLFEGTANEFSTPGAPSTGRVKAVEHPQLMWAIHDENGDTIDVNFDDKVEVDSGLGHAVYQVTRQPEQVRKKPRSSIIMHLADLERVREHEFEAIVGND